MDGGLIVLLIVIGLVAKLSNGKKKKAKGAQAGSPRKAEDIPYSREEWAEYLKASGAPAGPKPAKPAAQPAKARKEPPKATARPATPAAITPLEAASQGSLIMDPSQGIEGETAAEHAEHRRKAAEAEARQREDLQAQQALRDINLQKLRAAVVMKEILDKPVSLRPRRFY